MDPKLLGVLEGVLKCFAALLALVTALSAFRKSSAGPPAGSRTVKVMWVLTGCGCLAVAGFAGWLFLFRPPSGEALSRFLAKRDPNVFFGAKDGRYKLARVVADRSDLETNTRLSETIDNTEMTFDLLVISGGVFQHFQSDFERAIERGVRVRIIAQDPGSATKMFYDAIYSAPRDSSPNGERAQALATLNAVSNLKAKIESNRDRFKGSLELRWMQKPLFYSIWLKDAADRKRAVGHISVFSYRSPTWDPCFRVGYDGFELVNGLREEFEGLWGIGTAQPSP